MSSIIIDTILRIGLWEEHVGVYFHHGHLDMLEKRGVGIDGGLGFSSTWDEFTRCLRLEVAELSASVVHESSDPDVWPYRLQVPAIPTARCIITSMRFELQNTALVCIIPPDHELPWPLLRECRMFDRDEVARREITKRLASQRAHGVAVSLGGIPREFQMAITAAERVEIAQEAGYAPAKEAAA